ncbi:MAG: hypothetical protein IID54_06620 [Proteobacteria bacterium]|nr:hypothetical protein [Pseudomonadota bacterium]
MTTEQEQAVREMAKRAAREVADLAAQSGLTFNSDAFARGLIETAINARSDRDYLEHVLIECLEIRSYGIKSGETQLGALVRAARAEAERLKDLASREGIDG